MEKIFYFLVGAILFLAACFGMYKLVGSGEFMDWTIGALSFLWLIFIVTIPWNSYFKAKEILYEAEVSRLKNIAVKEEGVIFAQSVSRRSLIVSISLHIISAGALFYIANRGISQVGYYTAGLTILLTFLRPGIRFYEYLHRRLEMIRQEFQYPREDVQELLAKVNDILYRTVSLEGQLSAEEGSGSLRLQVEGQLSQIREKLKKLDQKMDDVFRSNRETKNDIESKLAKELEGIRKENKELVAKITESGEVVESISTIAKYLKKL